MSIQRVFSAAASKILRNQNFTKILPKSAVEMTISLEKMKENNKICEDLAASIKHELDAIRREKIAIRKRQLKAENDALLAKVEQTKAILIALEIRNGKKQINVPNTRGICTEVTNETAVPATANEDKQQKPQKEKKPKKEKSVNVANTTTAGAATAMSELPIDVGRLDMRVGKIIDVQRHPDADSLYLEKIDCGEEKPRTVVSGLVKFVPLEEMQNRMVIVMCNLKPAKMRGITSEAMVMCASTPDKVEVLSPPPGALPGDLVHCENYARQPDAQLNPKKKIFETCAPDLMTNGDLIACYKGSPLHVPGKGNIVAQTLRNVNVK